MSDHESTSIPTEFAGEGGEFSSVHDCGRPMNTYVFEALSPKSSLNCFALWIRNLSVIIAAILKIS